MRISDWSSDVCSSDLCLILGDIMQFGLTDDQTAIQEMARRFTADAITPHAAEWDEKHIFPRATVKAAAELGFGAIYASEDSGGIGHGRLEAGLVMEARAYGLPSTAARSGERGVGT